MDTVPYKEKGNVFPVHNILLLPGVSTMIYYAQEPSGLREALAQDAPCLLVPIRKDASTEEITQEDFYRLGVSFTGGQLAANEKGSYFSAKLLNRVQIHALYQENGQWMAEYTTDLEQVDLDEKSAQQMLAYMKETIGEMAAHFKNGEVYTKMMDSIHDLNTMIAYLCQFLPLSAQEKYELLEMDSLKKRGLTFMDVLLKQKETLEVNLALREKISDKTSRAYRRQILREQMHAIQEELDEDGQEEGDDEEESYQTRIQRAHLPSEVEAAAFKEAKKLDAMGMGNSEENIIRNYLDFLLSLPWQREAAGEIDLKKARAILDGDHYGLEKVKERILQHLAVMKLRPEKKGSILLFVGPPGTGKTSLGKSIARALNRSYVRLSLGGIHDEAEIRGHRRTYVGALAGSVLKSMQKAKTTNPVMVLDEVDKVGGGGYNGDPASALLEVLDPEQNNTFHDHYLDLPYDLSDVFFIATANSLDTIPQPLLDRMEVISISGYSEEEKFHIGKDHLIPQVLEEIGLEQGASFTDGALKGIIEGYTREAGVRGLKKQLSAAARGVAKRVVMEELSLPVTIKKRDLEELLGQPPIRHDRVGKQQEPGVVTGLAWTPVGGEILFIEAVDMPGSGNLKLTGKLGDVMQESAMISLSLLRSRLPLHTSYFKEHDIHIHVPDGAVPKDGPSAGVTLFTALASLCTGIAVPSTLAMTGEITLRGTVSAIGGLQEKLLAARQAGIRKVLIPKENEGDLKELSQAVKDSMEIVCVENADDVLRQALGISLKQLAYTFEQVHPEIKELHAPLANEGDRPTQSLSILRR